MCLTDVILVSYL